MPLERCEYSLEQHNKPFPSCFSPLFQNQSWRTTLIFKTMAVQEKKTHFNKERLCKKTCFKTEVRVTWILMALSALKSVCDLLRPFILHHTSRPCFPNRMQEGINTPIVVHITQSLLNLFKNSVIPHGMCVGIQRLGGVG